VQSFFRKDDVLVKYVRKMNEMQKSDEFSLPIKVQPYIHQKKACEFMLGLFGLMPSEARSRGTALLMEMGTGKTIVSIAVAGRMYQRGKIKRVLVVAPLSILGVWEEEFEQFADFPYTLTVLKGTAAKKKEQLSHLPGDGLQVVVVNYESAWRLEKELLAYDADLVIADEAHKLKENRTSQSKGMHRIGDKARYKLLLTGTVITNRELDVFSQYRFLNPAIFGTSFYTFRNRYFDMCGYGNHTPIFRRQMTDEFLQKLHSIAFRVTKAECLDLPSVTEEVRTVELETSAAKIYGKIEAESYAELAESEVTTVNILTRILRLSQTTGGYLTDDDGTVNAVSRAKLDALADILDAAMAEDRKLVVMARFVAELDAIQELLKKSAGLWLFRRQDGCGKSRRQLRGLPVQQIRQRRRAGQAVQEQAHALPPARRRNVPADAFPARRFAETFHAVCEESAFQGKEIEQRRYENHAEKGRQCVRHRLFPSRVHFRAPADGRRTCGTYEHGGDGQGICGESHDGIAC